MIISWFPSGTGGGIMPQFSYSGDYSIEATAGGWKVKFLTSGTLKMISSAAVDIFAVGGGGSGSFFNSKTQSADGRVSSYYGGGGGAGYTATEKNVSLVSGGEYTITVGGSGSASSFEDNGTVICSANGGNDGEQTTGGNGGSGGAGGSFYTTYSNGSYYAGDKSVLGGTNGADGHNGKGVNTRGGNGQRTTTREFGEESGDLYASGGGAYSPYERPPAVIANTGNGGAGGKYATIGASGIVVMRNTRGDS